MSPIFPDASQTRFDANLNWLQQFDPFLVSRILGLTSGETIEIRRSRSGLPVPVFGSISLHSQYDPEKEARQLIPRFQLSKKATSVIFGLGFGYHLFEWLERNPGRVDVIEPSLNLFATWLYYVDLPKLGERVRFFVDQPPEKLMARHSFQECEFLPHPPSQQVHSACFSRLEETNALTKHLAEKPLRVLIVPPIYGGSLPTAQHTFNAFEQLGHETFWVDCDHYAEAFHSIQNTTSNVENSEILAQRFMELMGEVVIAKAAEVQPDLIFGLAQAPLSKATFDRLRSM